MLISMQPRFVGTRKVPTLRHLDFTTTKQSALETHCSASYYKGMAYQWLLEVDSYDVA